MTGPVSGRRRPRNARPDTRPARPGAAEPSRTDAIRPGAAEAGPRRLDGAEPLPASLTPATRRYPRPTKEQLAAAADTLLPDVIAPGLDVLFVGINPGLWSAATGWHFARPGNRFWPALHRGGFTPRRLHPSEQDELPRLGLGITNLVARATARADELTPAELVAGAAELTGKVERYRPRWVAVVGVTAYRIGFARPKAGFGPQPEPLGGAPLWVLPNPSGLNAHFTPETLGAAFAGLRAAIG
ncbi:G/U mismatch-specific uracil-DNA glycosylase [Micromonospora narathiwatensis]|uniref:G/U mismatch-specific uracil-DNA glycosylase n=1 Tax=Micromonospora narathiwatensis TaxID=299146 RepID=A0A1A8ZUS7_9ACTN|nr:G/U mismatch-specific uracil-DNA glycosylase [Micromonospora narathiwatensis]